MIIRVMKRTQNRDCELLMKLHKEARHPKSIQKLFNDKRRGKLSCLVPENPLPYHRHPLETNCMYA